MAEQQQVEPRLIASMPLSSDEVKALRTADSIVFWQDTSGQGRITAQKKRMTDGYDDPLTRTIFVDSKLTDYARERTGEGSTVPSDERSYLCVHSITSPRYDAVWQTITQIMKAGDVLSLYWIGTNNNQHLEEDDLVKDEFHLRLQRQPKIRWEFYVDDSVTTKSSTARMVRRQR